jgi:hypothetical protein
MNIINQDPKEDNEVKAFLSSYPQPIISIVLELRQFVLDLAPEVIEQIDYPAKMIAYGYKKTYQDTICVIMPYRGWVNLGFPRGATLPDPISLLNGTGKRARHVKISNIEEINLPALTALLKASIAQIQQ